MSGRKTSEVAFAKDTLGIQEVTPGNNSTLQGLPLLPATLNKRPRGRPRKLPIDVRVKKSFAGLVADAEPLMSPVSEDGGGTPETSPNVTRESLERRVSRRLNVLDRYLTDERLHQLLVLSGLKEIGIYEGIMMDKVLVLKGQPNVIIGSDDRIKLSDVLPSLLRELRRRKLVTTVSERKIEFQGEIVNET